MRKDTQQTIKGFLLATPSKDPRSKRGLRPWAIAFWLAVWELTSLYSDRRYFWYLLFLYSAVWQSSQQGPETRKPLLTSGLPSPPPLSGSSVGFF